ncbi:MAG: type II secretion system F family protein [Desulfoarculaceae bacterium]|nr:type II secretion system F family protein [Desulfoarculaceae bacterium]
MKFILPVALFFLIIAVCELVYSLFVKPDTRTINKVVERYSTGPRGKDELDILYYRKFSDIKLLDRMLSTIPAVRALDALMQQGGVSTLASVFLLSTLTAGAGLLLICTSLQLILPLSILITGAGMVLPFLYLLYKRKQRRSAFETLFPDALDLMGYSLKAGHSILASFKMVAEEIAAPVGEEFNRVVEEINFGRDLDSSLRNFSNRVDSPELRFFVTSVIIQHETGGNLVEMLQRISEVIRRKFRFREKVKTLSAEGKLSAIILVALPFLIATAIIALNPGYIMVLVSDPIGPYAIAIALTMMAIGSFIMYKLVQLDM